jgi:TBC1 domain family member 20
MEDLKIILRLYDFFIVSHPLMPIYLGSVIVTDKSDEILQIDCDMASLHTVITKYPSRISDPDILEDYLLRTIQLFEQYPPHTLNDLNSKWVSKWFEFKINILISSYRFILIYIYIYN